MISLCIIVKNEERYLPGCFESVKDIVDEIILVDTGSTDNTLNIAKQYNAKVFHFPWINDFAAARNFSLQQATGNWILYLDADERLNRDSAEELKKITSSAPTSAYKCKVVSINSENNHHSIMSYSRLFPNMPDVRFTGKVHEQIEESLNEKNIHVYNSNIEIIHLGYDVSQAILKNKAERNLKILLDEYKRTGASYYSFQLGQTLGILARKEEAEYYFTEALKDRTLQKEYRGVAHRYLAINYTEKKDFTRALEEIERSIAEDDKQPLNMMAAAKIYLHLKMNDKAANAALKAFEANTMFFSKDVSSAQNIMMDETEVCMHGLEVAVKTVNRDLFNFFFKKLNNSNNNGYEIFSYVYNNELISTQKINKLIQSINLQYIGPLLIMLEQYTQNKCKEELLRALVLKFSENPAVHLQLGKLYLSLGKYREAETEIEKTIIIHPEEPSFYFYLISAYIQNSSFEKIKNIIIEMENRFKSHPEVLSKIEMLKHKLTAYLKH